MKRLCTFIRRALCVAALTSSAAVAAPGELDVQFGVGAESLPGTAVLPISIPNGNSVVNSLAVQDDLKIVAAGAAGRDIGVARFRVDGKPDPDFGTGGLVTTPMTGFFSPGAMALQADGRIVVTGGGMNGQERTIVLVRYLPNGLLDGSFGSGGMVFAGIADATNYARAVTVLPDGKILAGGGSYAVDPVLKIRRFQTTLLCRFNPDGTPDNSFGSAGIATVGSVTAESIAVRADGKIVAAGTARVVGGSGQLWLARCHANGSLDTAFGDGGTVTMAPLPAGNRPEFHRIALQSDGKIVAAGEVVSELNYSNFDFLVCRFHPDGSPDLSFNGTGRVTTDLTPGTNPSYDFANTITVQSDGKLLVAGTANTRCGLVRYLTDGSLDTDFGAGGKVITQMQEGGCGTTAIALQPDGRIVTGGNSGATPFSDSRMALARYLDRDGPQGLTVEWPPGAVLKNGQTVELGLAAPNNPKTLETAILLRNTGAVPLTGLSAVLNGPGAARFTVVSPPPPVLEAGGSATLTIRFSAAAELSSFGALLVIHTANPDISEFVMTLHGSTDHPVAILGLYDGAIPIARGATVNFGTAFPVPGNTRIFTIKNTGNIELLVQGITLGTAGTPQDFIAGPPQADVLQGGDSTTFPVTFSPTGTGPRTAKLRIASTDTFNPPYEITLSGTLAPGFPAWRQAHFGTTLNEGPAASLSDPDDDGIPNLLEYAALTSPVNPGGIPARIEMIGNTLQYSITGPSGTAAELSYALEWSDSPHLSWNTTGVTASPGPDDGTQQQFQFSVPAGPSGKRFVRLRVTER
ncbi:MAG TPA: choice-of-anchor D domain-containing protein [Verrucomicrobiales bacterium]|nr:choice-of-anchor D domain-containing protein [Verrucomicrobiales bacterium]